MNVTGILKSIMELSGTKRRAVEYPEPCIVPPRSGEHRQSFIILHGRGDRGENFGALLLMMVIPEFKALQDAFPDGQFIFPTASERRAAAFGRTPINQWFDNWSLQDPTERAELQYDGLRGSSQFVHHLLEKEIAAVGPENVVLWGLSQGMAISMISLLLWNGPKLAAAVGMCGWIPLKAQLEQAAQDNHDDLEDEDNPFGDCGPSISADAANHIESPNFSETSKLEKASSYLRNELGIAPEGQPSSTPLEIPIYLGHGTEDEKVPTVQGQEAQELLQVLGLDVEFQRYDGLGHWYSPDMLHDIIQFLQRKTGIKPYEGSTEDVGTS